MLKDQNKILEFIKNDCLLWHCDAEYPFLQKCHVLFQQGHIGEYNELMLILVNSGHIKYI